MQPRWGNNRRQRAFWVLIVLEWTAVIGIAAALLSLANISQLRSLASFPRPTAILGPIKTTSVALLPSPTAALPTDLAFTPSPEASQTPLTAHQLVWENTPLALPTRQGLAGKIVFTCTPERFNQLCLIQPDGSGLIRLTERSANDYYPSLSSDGSSVIFVSNQSGQFEIYLRHLALQKEQRLTDGIGNVSAPDTSPDGQQVIFASKFSGGDSSIWMMGSDGSGAHPLTDSRWDEIDPSWSPDGNQIAFAGSRGGYVELFVMDSAGGAIRQVTSGVQGIGGRSSWSPDSRWLVFYAGPRGDRDIYLVEVESGKTTRLTGGGNNTGPSFSPDGEWIAFSSSRDGDHELYIMRLDGSQLTQLTDNAYDDWQPRWGR